MDDNARYEAARKQVRQLAGFYQHAAMYLLVNALLLAINLLTTPQSLWFYWPLLGWGTGLALHAVAVFGSSRLWGREWEERKIRELMETRRSG